MIFLPHLNPIKYLKLFLTQENLLDTTFPPTFTLSRLIWHLEQWNVRFSNCNNQILDLFLYNIYVYNEILFSLELFN